jgi:hypothetical protein
MFLHMITGSLFRQPMKYQIITCEGWLSEFGMTGFWDKRFQGRSGGPQDGGFRGKGIFYRRPAASSHIVPKSTSHPEERKPEPERV